MDHAGDAAVEVVAEDHGAAGRAGYEQAKHTQNRRQGRKRAGSRAGSRAAANRRRRHAKPSSPMAPMPSRTKVEGSGTHLPRGTRCSRSRTSGGVVAAVGRGQASRRCCRTTRRANHATRIDAFETTCFVPLPHVAALVERAVGAVGVLELADLRPVVRAADRVPPLLVVSSRCCPDRSDRPGRCSGTVSLLGRIVEVVARHAVVLVVRRLVPLVLARDRPTASPRCGHDRAAVIAVVAVERVRAVLGGRRHPAARSAGRCAASWQTGSASQKLT